jgi:hypothetical protein
MGLSGWSQREVSNAPVRASRSRKERQLLRNSRSILFAADCVNNDLVASAFLCEGKSQIHLGDVLAEQHNQKTPTTVQAARFLIETTDR